MRNIISICKTNPELVKEWNYEKNLEIRPQDVSRGSMKHIWWTCSKCGHMYSATVNHRSNGSGCPECWKSRSKVILQERNVRIGETDLFSHNPELEEEWDYEKNIDLDPTKLSYGSVVKAWWKCKECGASFQQRIHDRTRKDKPTGCKECSKIRRSKMHKSNACYRSRVSNYKSSIKLKYPDAILDWDYDKNTKTPDFISYGSTIKCYWKCHKCGYEWSEAPKTKVNRKECPHCGGKGVFPGENDLQTVEPEIAAEWDYEKNNPLTPDQVTSHSKRKVWWICRKGGHSWEAVIDSRIGKKSGCPYCSNQKVSEKYGNDFQSLYPEIAAEWDYKLNTVLPSTVAPRSGYKAYWICRKGHSWQARISTRVYYYCGCPICNQELQTSFPEQVIAFYLNKIFDDIKNRDKSFGKEIDILIPQKKIAVEYDGYFWHKNRLHFDNEKNQYLKEKGLKVIRIRENPLPQTDYAENIMVDYNYSRYNYLEKAIKDILEIVKVKYEPSFINIPRDIVEIEKQFIGSEKKVSLLNSNPELSKEWDHEKNDPLTPEMITPTTRKKVYWKCHVCGYSWKASPAARMDKKRITQCPVCSGRLVNPGKTDLETINPSIAMYWDYEKNGGLLPSDVTANSHKVVHWKCPECAHEWSSSVYSRNSTNGCPVCSGYTIKKGINDLASSCREIMLDWNYEQNVGIDPETIGLSSRKKIHWKCHKCGKEWVSKVYVRARNKSGCPECWKSKSIEIHNVAVINIDTGETYSSLKDAAKAYNGIVTSISNCINGRAKTAYGCRWKKIKQ